VSRDVRRFLLLACPLVVLAACAVGNRIYISGEPSRPGAPRRPAEAPRAVVLDFAYVAVEPGVVGSVLAEGGVAAVRAAAESPSLDTVPIRISGTVGRFEVNARRKGTVKIVNEATVSLSVTVAGGTLPSPVSFSATSTNSMEDVFVTPDGLRNVLFSAANAAAEEAGRRLLGAGVVAPPPSGK
jgi:hypothetical protein